MAFRLHAPSVTTPVRCKIIITGIGLPRAQTGRRRDMLRSSSRPFMPLMGDQKAIRYRQQRSLGIEGNNKNTFSDVTASRLMTPRLQIQRHRAESEGRYFL